jgi:hypothetical protein
MKEDEDEDGDDDDCDTAAADVMGNCGGVSIIIRGTSSPTSLSSMTIIISEKLGVTVVVVLPVGVTTTVAAGVAAEVGTILRSGWWWWRYLLQWEETEGCNCGGGGIDDEYSCGG